MGNTFSPFHHSSNAGGGGGWGGGGGGVGGGGGSIITDRIQEVFLWLFTCIVLFSTK